MSEKSTSTETLSINCSISITTDDEACVTAFLDDFAELLGEWQTKVQITSANVSTHDHRKFEDKFKLSEEDKK